MTNDEYLALQGQLAVMAHFVAGLDLDGFIARIDHAETLAPLLDPTLYRQGAAKLRVVREIAEAARAFRRALPREVRALVETGLSLKDGATPASDRDRHAGG